MTDEDKKKPDPLAPYKVAYSTLALDDPNYGKQALEEVILELSTLTFFLRPETTAGPRLARLESEGEAKGETNLLFTTMTTDDSKEEKKKVDPLAPYKRARRWDDEQEVCLVDPEYGKAAFAEMTRVLAMSVASATLRPDPLVQRYNVPTPDMVKKPTPDSSDSDE